MTTTVEATLARARAGDEAAFRALTDPHRRELQLHCYRIVGSVQDAEDLVQETLLAGWRSLATFESRSSLRSWLYRIATNRCLNALRDRSRRPRVVDVMTAPLEPTRRIETVWLDPYPDALLEGVPDVAPGPEARYELTEAIGLAFVTALQHLPPRQRAALVLADVLGYRTAEVAEILDTGETSVKGALQRARATLRERRPEPDREQARSPGSSSERRLLERFAEALRTGDVDGLVTLLAGDALLTMPPQPLEYEGHAAIAAFLRQRMLLRGAELRVALAWANGQPAFGCYAPDPQTQIAHPRGLFVLTLAAHDIAALTWFGDTGAFASFGLPETLP